MSASSDRLFNLLSGRIRRPEVLAAMRRVAREDFLDASMTPRADSDAALPIGYAQTTSSPFVIARMLEMLADGGAFPQKVLEIGSGSGYQTALLAELGCEVVGVERIRPLADAARARLRKLNYRNIRIVHADGNLGYESGGLYGGIIICAETPAAPPALLQQLEDGGRLVLPLRAGNAVRLCAMDNSGAALARREYVEFVPMRKGVQ